MAKKRAVNGGDKDGKENGANIGYEAEFVADGRRPAQGYGCGQYIVPFVVALISNPQFRLVGLAKKRGSMETIKDAVTNIKTGWGEVYTKIQSSPTLWQPYLQYGSPTQLSEMAVSKS
jgi:hypothetical protein